MEKNNKITGKNLPSIGDPDTDWIDRLPLEERKKIAEIFEAAKPRLDKAFGEILIFGTSGEDYGRQAYKQFLTGDADVDGKNIFEGEGVETSFFVPFEYVNISEDGQD